MTCMIKQFLKKQLLMDLSGIMHLNLQYKFISSYKNINTGWKKIQLSHNDSPFLPEKITINKKEKLISNFKDKENCIVHFRNLQDAFIHGLKLTKVDRVIKFNKKE